MTEMRSQMDNLITYKVGKQMGKILEEIIQMIRIDVSDSENKNCKLNEIEVECKNEENIEMQNIMLVIPKQDSLLYNSEVIILSS